MFTGGIDHGRFPADTRPHIEVRIGNRAFYALLDTGAVANAVGETVANHLRDIGQTSTTVNVGLRMADGTSSRATEEFSVSGMIGECHHSWAAFYVTSLTSDLILGINLIRELGLNPCDWDGLQSQLDVRDSETSNPLDTLATPTDSQEKRLREFLDSELPLFNDVSGRTHLVQHEIHLKPDVTPIKQRHYPRNPAMQAVINDEVESMLRDGVIEPSSSAWSSPIVMIKKSAGNFRFCIDMRRVNESSVKDAYPLPQINSILEKLRHATFISTLDLFRGYWQVPLAEDSRPITAFTVPGLGLYQFRVMPFGLHSAGATFQRLLDTVIGPELEPQAFAYLDDLVLVTKTFEEHLELLRTVFKRLRDAGLKLNPDKCHFCKSELKYLGHMVNQNGIATDPEKVKAIESFPTPHNVKSLRSFLGLASWYRRFVTGFATVTRPLTKLLKKDIKWSWDSEQQLAFDELKRLLCTTPILSCPDFSVPFVLQVDASNEGLGASLTQIQNGHEVVIAYASRLLSEPERNFTTTEKECLALVWSVRKFRPYLEGYKFIAVTDHVALKWLMKLHEPSGRLARWVMELQQFDFEIRYRKGTLNRVADALSRQPVNELNIEEPVDISVYHGTLDVPAGQPGEVQEASGESSRLPWVDELIARVTKNPERHRDYLIKDGRLYRSFHTASEQIWKLCVPPHLKDGVLVETHDSKVAGHLGIKKTLSRVAANYFWPGWRRDVKQYVRSCPSCQAYKVQQMKPAGHMYLRRPKGPWHAVSADIMGPLPTSKGRYRFLLAFQDQYSKWVELEPICSATAQAVATKFKNAILFRYGSPEVLITDNGTQFTSKIFRDLAKDWDIEIQYTAPYSPQSNPVERANRVIKTMLSQYVKDNHKSWANFLGELRYAINTAVHDSTGYSPASLCTGRELRVPNAIRGPLFVTAESDVEPSLEEIRALRGKKFRSLYEACQRNLRNAFTRQAKFYNLRRRLVSFKPGDLVMRRIHILSSADNAIAGKLAPKFKGPCAVVGRKGSNMYVVEDEDTTQTHVVHVKDLKPFHSR